jgi:hypothetical protein
MGKARQKVPDLELNNRDKGAARRARKKLAIARPLPAKAAKSGNEGLGAQPLLAPNERDRNEHHNASSDGISEAIGTYEASGTYEALPPYEPQLGEEENDNESGHSGTSWALPPYEAHLGQNRGGKWSTGS